MLKRRWFRFTLWGVGGLLVIALAGFLWLRNSPYWAGITLFAENYRVENFRGMDQVFPYRTVARTGDVWAFGENPVPLPVTYDHDGEQKDLAEFLDRTVTTGLLVVRDGEIVHEEYRLGADETSPFTSWSMAKSVVSALIGIAVAEGDIDSIQDPIGKYVPSLTGTAYENVPIEDVLTMSSGVAFNEDYDDPLSDVNMLFIDFPMGTPLNETIAGLEKAREPGVFNDYISADTIALGLVLEGATGVPANEYLETRLWGPMGAEADAFWSVSRSDEVIPLCCLNATLRDYARFGRLYLEGGARDGAQIVPADWVEQSVNPTAAHLQPGDNPASSWTFGYGYKWWVPEDPQGDFLAIGIWGQYIYVDPARDIVIVKTSADPEFDANDHESVAAFRSIAATVTDGRPGDADGV
ncbi:serine hydrolase domain-containing protein [Bauldia sp.]|uniref:serine hydrolase domain-containing protein n=1 Tax=Bauldia sp. TaxID=2575872 RepID=UPI003BAD7FCE